MKLSLILLVACSALAIASERPNGFLGIAWGASPEEAKRVLQKRPGVVFPENADDYRIELTGGSFAGQPVTKWVIEFPDRKFASATVTLKAEVNAPAVFREFRAQLVSKYGSTTTDKRIGSTGKSKDGQTQPTGSMAVWKFKPSMKETGSVLISAEITGANMHSEESGGTITIKYVNETLAGTTDGNGKPAGKTVPPVKKEDL